MKYIKAWLVSHRANRALFTKLEELVDPTFLDRALKG